MESDYIPSAERTSPRANKGYTQQEWWAIRDGLAMPPVTADTI